MSISRRELFHGFGSIGLLALFRRRGVVDSPLIEIVENDILEEYEENPSAIDMVVIAQTAFRADRIVIPNDIAHLWDLENITIGQVSQFASPNTLIPAEVFTPDSFGNTMSMDVLSPGIEFKMRVRRRGPVNLKDNPERFMAAIIGTGIDSSNGRRMILPISSDPYRIIT